MGSNYRPKVSSLVSDFMKLETQSNLSYPHFRCFDLYKLHLWAGGLTECPDGSSQMILSEAVNAYYAAAMMGLAYEDTHLVHTGSMLAALEIHAAQTWWHVKEGNHMYPKDFSRE